MYARRRRHGRDACTVECIQYGNFLKSATTTHRRFMGSSSPIHQAVVHKNTLLVFGGEFTSPNQEKFHHYKVRHGAVAPRSTAYFSLRVRLLGAPCNSDPAT